MIYALLFYEFFLIGLFALGGGAATIPFLFDLSKKYGWFSFDDLTNMIAISEATPGPIGVNMATFAGFETAGVSGALCATLGLIAPSVIVIVLFVKVIEKFAFNDVLSGVLKFVQPAVCALILNAALEIGLLSIKNCMAFVLLIFLLVLGHFYQKGPVFYILFSGVMGYVLKL